MLANAGGQIIYANPAADRILGAPPPEDTSEGWAEHYGIFLPDGSEHFPADEFTLVRALQGEETDDVEMLVRNDAHANDVLIVASGRPVRDEEGEIIGAVTIVRDVTEIRRAEAELRDAVDSLKQIQERKGELAGFLVHDMKSPLSTILASTELVQLSDALDEDERESLQDVKQAALTLHRMVMNMIDVQAAADGRLEPQLETLDALPILEEVADSFRTRKGVGNVLVEGLEDDATADVLADREMLRRIVTNLVENCAKYGPEDGRIWLEAGPSTEGVVRICVSDEGPGVPDELREAIFERYAKVERDDERRDASSRGLGLRFCKLAIEAHGGRLWVEDNDPVGARFCFELPRADPH